MLRVTLLGYYGFNNLGDEAVLFSIVELLRREIKEIGFTVLSNDPVQTASAYKVDAVNRWSLKEVYQSLKKSDALILGGGSLLQDVTGKKSLAYYLGIIAMALFLKKPVIYYAQGLGPLQSKLSRFLVAKVSKKAALISVRDEGSAKLFKEIGVSDKEIHLTADPVFGLEIDQFKAASSLGWEKAGITPKKAVIAFALRQWGNKEDYIQAIAFVADKLVEEGWEIVFCPYHFPADLLLAKEIGALMTNSPLILEKRLSLKEIISMPPNFYLTVGMRFHALAFSALNQIPFVGIAYDPKVEALCSLLDQPLLGRVEDLQEDTLATAIAIALKEREKLGAKLRENLPQLQARARRNALLVKQILLA